MDCAEEQEKKISESPGNKANKQKMKQSEIKNKQRQRKQKQTNINHSQLWSATLKTTPI